MKDSIIRRIKVLERIVEDDAPLEPVPVIMQVGLGGPFKCDDTIFPTEEAALAAYAHCADKVLVKVVDGRRKHNKEEDAPC